MLPHKKHLSIHIGRDKIKITLLSKGKDKVTLYKAFEIPTPEGAMQDGLILQMESLAEVIGQSLKSNNIRTKDTLFSIYHPRMITREVELPALAKAKLEKIIQANVQDYFPVDITGYLVGHRVVEIVGEKENRKAKVLLVAAPDEVMSQYMTLCKLLRLEMIGIDYQENSVLHFMSLQKFIGTHMLIHMDSEATTVAIGDYEKVSFVKTIPFGTASFVDAVQKQYGVSHEEAQRLLYKEPMLSQKGQDEFDVYNELKNNLEYMLNSISAYIKYYNSKNDSEPIQEIYLSGSGAQVPGIGSYIREQLQIGTNGLELLVGVVNKDKQEPNLLALGIETNIGAVFTDINLMPREMTDHMKSREKTRIVVLLAILALVSVAAILIAPINDIKQLEIQKQELTAQVEAYEKIAVVKGEYDKVMAGYSMREALRLQADSRSDHLLEILEGLEEDIPTGITIQSLSSTETGLAMNCLAEDRLTVARFISTLKGIESVNEVYVGSISEVAGPNPEVMVMQFAITCTY